MDCPLPLEAIIIRHVVTRVHKIRPLVTTIHSRKGVHFSSCDCELLPIILTFDLDPDSVKLKQRAKCPGRRSFSSKFIVRTQTDTHARPIALPGPVIWSAKTN